MLIEINIQHINSFKLFKAYIYFAHNFETNIQKLYKQLARRKWGNI